MAIEILNQTIPVDSIIYTLGPINDDRELMGFTVVCSQVQGGLTEDFKTRLDQFAKDWAVDMRVLYEKPDAILRVRYDDVLTSFRPEVIEPDPIV